MRTLMLAAMTGLALSVSLPALAGGGPAEPVARDHALYREACKGLEKEFDLAGPYGRMEPGLPKAEYLRGLGADLCMEGRYADGIATLRNALAAVKIHPLSQTGPLEDRAG